MAVADEAEGLAEAQRRIAACRETRSESLDLSNLGLTRVPEEVLELGWLRELNLKSEYWRRGIGGEGARALTALVNLTALNLEDNEIGDEGAQALSRLINLTTLDLSGNGIGEGAQALFEPRKADHIRPLWELHLRRGRANAVGPRQPQYAEPWGQRDRRRGRAGAGGPGQSDQAEP